MAQKRRARWSRRCRRTGAAPSRLLRGSCGLCREAGWLSSLPRLRASDVMEPNLTYVYPHTRVQSLVSILRTTVHHAFPVVTENRGNEKEFMKGNQLISNNIKFKVKQTARGERWAGEGRPFLEVHTGLALASGTVTLFVTCDGE